MFKAMAEEALKAINEIFYEESTSEYVRNESMAYLLMAMAYGIAVLS